MNMKLKSAFAETAQEMRTELTSKFSKKYKQVKNLFSWNTVTKCYKHIVSSIAKTAKTVRGACLKTIIKVARGLSNVSLYVFGITLVGTIASTVIAFVFSVAKLLAMTLFTLTVWCLITYVVCKFIAKFVSKFVETAEHK